VGFIKYAVKMNACSMICIKFHNVWFRLSNVTGDAHRDTRALLHTSIFALTMSVLLMLSVETHCSDERRTENGLVIHKANGVRVNENNSTEGKRKSLMD
jgi:hypothetical protein